MNSRTNPDRSGLTVDERRTVTVPVPADTNTLNRLINEFRHAANEGFEIVGASTRDDGNQRDPTVKAVVIVLRRSA